MDIDGCIKFRRRIFDGLEQVKIIGRNSVGGMKTHRRPSRGSTASAVRTLAPRTEAAVRCARAALPRPDRASGSTDKAAGRSRVG